MITSRVTTESIPRFRVTIRLYYHDQRIAVVISRRNRTAIYSRVRLSSKSRILRLFDEAQGNGLSEIDSQMSCLDRFFWGYDG